MTDGITGTVGSSPSIAPVASEEDMKAMQTLFQRVASSIVAASEYPAKLNDLATQVSALSANLESEMAHSNALNGVVIDLRETRDTAISHATDLGKQLSNALAQIEGLTSAKASAEQTIAQLNDELERTRKERDEYGLAHMQALDDLKAVRDKLGQVKDRFKELLAEPEAKPDAPLDIPNPGYLPAYVNEPIAHPPRHHEPVAPEPLPPEAMPEISPAPNKPKTILEWEPGYRFNFQTGMYDLVE